MGMLIKVRGKTPDGPLPEIPLHERRQGDDGETWEATEVTNLPERHLHDAEKPAWWVICRCYDMHGVLIEKFVEVPYVTGLTGGEGWQTRRVIQEGEQESVEYRARLAREVEFSMGAVYTKARRIVGPELPEGFVVTHIPRARDKRTWRGTYPKGSIKAFTRKEVEDHLYLVAAGELRKSTTTGRAS